MPRTCAQFVINIVIVKCAHVALGRTIRYSSVQLYPPVTAKHVCSSDDQKHLDIAQAPAV